METICECLLAETDHPCMAIIKAPKCVKIQLNSMQIPQNLKHPKFCLVSSLMETPKWGYMGTNSAAGSIQRDLWITRPHHCLRSLEKRTRDDSTRCYIWTTDVKEWDQVSIR